MITVNKGKKFSVKGLELDLYWDGDIDPTDWRNMPEDEEDNYENDEDLPASQYVVDTLGFDPDEE